MCCRCRFDTQSVQDRDDCAVFTDQSKFANQLRYFFRVDVVVIAGPVLAHGEFGMGAASPVQLEMHRGRIIRGIRDDFFKNRPKYALLQGGRRIRMIPELLQVIAKSEQLFSLFSSQRRCCDGGFFQSALDLGNLGQSVVPPLLQLACDKPIFRLGGLILPLDAAGFIACLLNRKFKRAPFFVGLVLTLSNASNAACMPTGRSASITSAATSWSTRVPAKVMQERTICRPRSPLHQ